MNSAASWQYDELKQIGKDYADSREVEAYDARHGKIRDVKKENESILKALGTKPGDVLIDLGAGTGEFALMAARRCSQVYAVDISPAMLEYAKTKAARANITNVVFCHGGFLTYSHASAPVDAIVSSMALHHLPDLWKGLALERLCGMLKPGGQMYLFDLVFEQRDLTGTVERLLRTVEAAGGPGMRADVEAHIGKEFSTYDWVIDGMLERAGFAITSKELQDGVLGRYLCRKRP